MKKEEKNINQNTKEVREQKETIKRKNKMDKERVYKIQKVFITSPKIEIY